MLRFHFSKERLETCHLNMLQLTIRVSVNTQMNKKKHKADTKGLKNGAVHKEYVCIVICYKTTALLVMKVNTSVFTGTDNGALRPI